MTRALLFLLAFSTASFGSAVNVLTRHNDNMRTGQNLRETVLAPANVNAGQFGKLFEQPVDGAVYGQPLYVSGLQIGGATHNVVFVVTEHDSVFAFDADGDTGPNAAPLWQDSFINPGAGITTVPSADVDSIDIYPEIGITSTPVIDLTANTIFVVAKTKENGTYVQRLHALDLATGQEKPHSPVVITATVLGQGLGNINGVITFDSLAQNQRSALLLLNGVIYIAWCSHGDNPPAHGWIMAYDEHTLAQVSTFITTPDGRLGSIWMAGCGLSADDNGNIYCATGDGNFDTDSSGYHIDNDYGDSLLKISTANRALSLVDYFTPSNQLYLFDSDLDLGSGGVMLLPTQPGPHPHLGVCAGKDTVLFVFDRDHLGGYYPGTPPNKGIYESLTNAIPGSFGTPAYFNGHIYFHAFGSGGKDLLKAFSVKNGYVSPVPSSEGTDLFGYPGATPSISASGASNGIVWEIENTGSSSPAVLHASRADNVAVRLYTSNDASSRDVPSGAAVKFTTPTITNGKVYVGTNATLAVFGLLSGTTSLTVNVSGSGTVTNGFSGTTVQEVNTPLTITAAPSPGSVFDSWTDVNNNLITRSPTYSFTMQENMVLNANFLANPFPGFTGNYAGIIQGGTPAYVDSGDIRLSVGAKGAFTSTVQFGGKTIKFHGIFNADGAYYSVLQPKSTFPTIISLSLNGAGGLIGNVSNSFAGGIINAASVVSVLPRGVAGNYTLLFPVPADPTAPQGIGYGSVTVDASAHVRISGILGDGVPFTEATIMTNALTWPFYLPLRSEKGLLIGILRFEYNNYDLDGPLYWYKTRPGSPALSVVVNTIGSIYQPSANPIVAFASGTGAMTLQLPAPISQAVTSSTTLTLSGAGPLTLTFNPSTGIFAGTFGNTGVTGTYGGAVFQDQNMGQGTFILTGSTGAVNLQ